MPHMPHLRDLEELVLLCRNEVSRSHIREAVACYHAQAYRSCIVSTWIAVVYDFIGKLRDLSFMGDKNAQGKLVEFEAICEKHDVRKSLDFERRLLEVARDDFELLSEIEFIELTRLLEDRHKCAHPSMLNPTQEYRPSAEVARYHLRTAVESFLRHAPAQGKAALERVLMEIEQQYYPDSLDDLRAHLSAGPLGNPRESLLRNFLIVALKHLLAPELIPEEAAPAERLRLRTEQRRRERRLLAMVAALHALHGEAVIALVTDRLDQIVSGADDDRLAFAVELVASVGGYWQVLSEAQQRRLQRFVADMPRERLNPTLVRAWETDVFREAAEQRVANFRNLDWQALEPGAIPEAWIRRAVNMLIGSTSWDTSNALIRGILIPSIDHLTVEDVERVIEAATTNPDILEAFAFPQFLSLAAGTGIGRERIEESLAHHGLTDSLRDRGFTPGEG
jgi:hypothetical protein